VVVDLGNPMSRPRGNDDDITGIQKLWDAVQARLALLKQNTRAVARRAA